MPLSVTLAVSALALAIACHEADLRRLPRLSDFAFALMLITIIAGAIAAIAEASRL